MSKVCPNVCPLLSLPLNSASNRYMRVAHREMSTTTLSPIGSATKEEEWKSLSAASQAAD